MKVEYTKCDKCSKIIDGLRGSQTWKLVVFKEHFHLCKKCNKQLNSIIKSFLEEKNV